ncbi:MAG: triose-phosphate isomerase [Candidatus Neomarinimicrobiota bacterium]
MQKIPIVAGNWKMNYTPLESNSFVLEIKKRILEYAGVKVIFCPPFTSLFNMVDILSGTGYGLAAQNMHWDTQGAYTGEISVSMLKDCAVDWVILGHSERRHIFGETDDFINQKLRTAFANDIKPMLCIGETLAEREAGRTVDVLKNQLKKGLKDDGPLNLKNLVIAYEPVWAIGTGQTATINQVENAHRTIAEFMETLFGDIETCKVPILYGGSVKQDNALGLIQARAVDGFLIGGASLDPDSFSNIIKIVHQNFKRN